jgi:hypothetical protein
MHQPGTQPPIALGAMEPLSREFETSYSVGRAEASIRRHAAARYLHRVRKKRFLSDIEMADITLKSPAARAKGS